MSMRKAKSSRPDACAKCGGYTLERRIAAIPARLTAPEKLAGKEIHVGRVAQYECLSCGDLGFHCGRTGQGGSLRWTRHRIPSCQSTLTDLLKVLRQEPLRALPKTQSKTKSPATALARGNNGVPAFRRWPGIAIRCRPTIWWASPSPSGNVISRT